MSSISSQPTNTPDALNRVAPTDDQQLAPAQRGAKAKGGLDQAVDDGTDSRVKALGEQSAAQDISASQVARAAQTVGAGLGATSSLPVLPKHADVLTPAAVSSARAALNNLPDSGAFNSIMAFQILQQAASKNFDAQGRAHTAALQSSLNKQTAIAQDTMAKAEADKKSATFSFMTNLAGAGAAFHLGSLGSGAKTRTSAKNDAEQKGATTKRVEDTANPTVSTLRDPGRSTNASSIEKMKAEKQKALAAQEKSQESSAPSVRDEKEKRRVRAQQTSGKIDELGKIESEARVPSVNGDGATRAGIYAASSGASQLVTSAGEAVNQNLLYGKDSHEAEIQQKIDELGKSVADQQLEGSKTSKEKAAKMIDDAISALKQHFDLVKSTNDRIGG